MLRTRIAKAARSAGVRGGRLVLALAVGSACLATQAAVRNDDAPDLLFVLWDPVAQVSYMRDLGLDANKFWIYAQQDAGYTYDYKLDASDPALIAFRTASTVTANQRWAVFAFDSGPTLAPGDTKIYSTLAQGPDGGGLNPNYTDLTTTLWGAVFNVSRNSGNPNQLIGGYNFFGTDPTKYVRAEKDGFFTSFDKVGSKGYFAGRTAFSGRAGIGDGSFLGGAYDVANAVNKSSWFYYVTNTADSTTVVVDEFDNLSANGYWGLSLADANPSTQYRLTFTQARAATGANSADTPAGSLRALQTEYAARTGSAFLIGLDEAELFAANPAGLDTAALASAVPEPASLGLFGLGLAGLSVALRRRRTC